MYRKYDSKFKYVGLGRTSNNHSDPKYCRGIYLYNLVSFIKNQISQTSLVVVTAFLEENTENLFAEITGLVFVGFFFLSQLYLFFGLFQNCYVP